MLDKIYEPAKQFLTTIGASVGGITAIFYAVGFFAVQSSHSFLGLTNVTVDFKQYLFMGGRFFAYLPSFIIFLFNIGLEIISKNFQWFFLFIVSILVIRGLLLIKIIRKGIGTLVRWIKLLISKYLVFFQIVAVVIFLWIFLQYSISIVVEQNWLFREPDVRTFWLIDISSNGSYMRQLYFAKLMTFVLISLIIWGALERIRYQKKTNQIHLYSREFEPLFL